MPDARDVRPKKWADLEVLFDDGEYSLVHGAMGVANTSENAGMEAPIEHWGFRIFSVGLSGMSFQTSWRFPFFTAY